MGGFQSFWFLNVEIMPRHVDFCVTHDILDGFNVHAQSLHLRNKGMPTAMWRQHADTLDSLQSLFELGSEVGWVTGHIRPAGFPDEFLLGVPQVPGTVLSQFRYRNRSVAVIRLGCPDNCRSLYHHYCLGNVNRGTVLRNVPWL